MELLISIFLGVWVAAGAVICLIHYKNDEKRDKKYSKEEYQRIKDGLKDGWEFVRSEEYSRLSKVMIQDNNE